MLVEDRRFYYTPGDLRAFAICQFSALRRADAVLGRGAVTEDSDVLGRRMGQVGLAHQQRVLDGYLQRYGDAPADDARGGVAVLSGAADPSGIAAADAIRALNSGPQVAAQVPISAGPLYGVADLLVRSGDRWQLTEIRLGLRLKDVYLLQIGAIALALLSRGVRLESDAVLITGNDARVPVPLPQAMNRARAEMSRIDAALADRLADPQPLSWENDSVSACGWCAVCQDAMTAARDVRLTAGVRMPDRVLLRSAGIRTIDQLATTTGPVDGLRPERLDTIRAQARLQVRQMPPGTELDPAMQSPPVFEVYDDAPLRALPDPDPGDVFFDLESDPLWVETEGDTRGLHYLFGMWLPRFTRPYVALWAHDRSAERRALLAFTEFIAERRRAHPRLHVYHYGSYETVVLTELAKRHDTAADLVAQWIESGLFIDLLPAVRASLRTSQPGYGLKKIEPLYMTRQPRVGAVLDGAASVLGYQRYTELCAGGHAAEADAVLDTLARYNEYDCLSTMRLRDWLRGLIT